jgi:hypothetical protein
MEARCTGDRLALTTGKGGDSTIPEAIEDGAAASSTPGRAAAGADCSAVVLRISVEVALSSRDGCASTTGSVTAEDAG